MSELIKKIPLVWLILIAGWMAIAPVQPEPHLLEKWRMLLSGTLSKPIDWFDWVIHSLPLALLVWRGWLEWQSKRSGNA